MSRPHIIVGVIGSGFAACSAFMSFARASAETIKAAQESERVLAPKDRRPYYRQFEKRPRR